MIKTLIHYQIYIIIGILVFPVFAFLIYSIKNIVERSRFIRTLHTMRQPLIDSINAGVIFSENQEQNKEIDLLIQSIKNDIAALKNDIQEIQLPNTPVKPQTAEEIYAEAIMQKRIYEEEMRQQHTSLQQKQIQVMKENINKFLVVYKEKDQIIQNKEKLIAEQNATISGLQQRINEIEQHLQKYTTQHQHTQHHEAMLQQKDRYIEYLQSKINDIESKLQHIILLNNRQEGQFFSKKICDIDQEIEKEKRKNRILILLFLIILATGIGTLTFIYTHYLAG